MDIDKIPQIPKMAKQRSFFSRLRRSLKYRPKLLNLILKMRQCLRKKNLQIKILNKQLNVYNNPAKGKKDSSCQTEDLITDKSQESIESKEAVTDCAWNVNEKGDSEKSIADQVKEVAQNALKETGMVYVESARMYYDYKTGYYYNSELGLYYHTDTNCYYYYSDEKQTFVFHSYPDRSVTNPGLEAHEKRKARKLRKSQKTDGDIENLTKQISQDKEDEATKPKRRKIVKRKTKPQECGLKGKESLEKNDSENKEEDQQIEEKKENKIEDSDKIQEEEDPELEDGECSDSEAVVSEEEDNVSVASTSTASDDECVAKHHPPCMRVIVRETTLPKLKIGSLFMITKDGGTVGREGEHHAILLRDNNVSRNHLDIRYDMNRRAYFATDLGSKNGSILNGNRMSESQVTSQPMEVQHGSVLQLGETKLLCHIHAGTDTCGHCEPGLLMEAEEKEKVAYTRTCSVQKQYQLELARLKNRYAPELPAIELTPYNDRAQARREAVGSSHHSVKTQSADLETSIAPDNKGFKLLQKMGWSKGEGLGKESQGEVEPVPLISNEGKSGLGTVGAASAPSLVPKPKPFNRLGQGTMRLVTKTNLLKAPAKAFQDLDDDEEET